MSEVFTAERKFMQPQDTIDTLNDLIETSKDGEYGFETAAEYLKNPQTKELFLSRAVQCREAARELRSLVLEMGGDAQDSGSISGAMHRGWVSVKGRLAGFSDEAILDEVERGEDIALERYQDALEDSLPPKVRACVEKQFQGVKFSHDRVRSLRDQARIEGN
jgi:uncharacterized protein (TIGR02284 family)